MKFTDKLRGGRRHFHLIIFILVLSALAFVNIAYFATTTHLTSPQKPQVQLQIEQYSPQQIEVNKLYAFITKVTIIPDSLERYQLADAVYTCGTYFSIDPILLLAIAKVESDFHKYIIGWGGCAGYFQVNLAVHKVSDLFLKDTYEQTEKACEILVYCKKISHGSLLTALNRYNGNSGSENPYAAKIFYQYNYYKTIIGK